MTNYSYAMSTIFDASLTPEPGDREDISQMVQMYSEAQEKTIYLKEYTTLAKYLYDASRNTGSYVLLSKEFSFCPGLIDDNQKFIPLFSFIEVLDELIDYDRIQEQFPSLSQSQIAGAISFLRKITQFNVKGLNIEHIIENDLSGDYLEELRIAFNYKGNERVLNFD